MLLSWLFCQSQTFCRYFILGFLFGSRTCNISNILQIQDNTASASENLLSQNAFGYVLPITSFVVAWLETWFLDFKVLTQEADDERGESTTSGWSEHGEKHHNFKTLCSSSSAYLAAVNAACERAPIIYPRALSDGQFYSPPESVAGDLLDLFFRFSFCFCEDIRAADWGFFSSKRLSAGSEEDLDEEGLGRRAVTPQVVGTYGAQWLPLSTSSCLTCLLISRRRSMWDRVGRPCPWWSRSWPRRRTGSLRKTMWVSDSAPIEPPLSGWRVSTSCGLVQRQFRLLNLCCWCNWSK